MGEKSQRAILGMDIVSFSTLTDDNQLHVIGKLMLFIREALAFHAITYDEVRWSPAGDGGYLTFVTDSGCRLAIDVAFSLFEKIKFQPHDAPDRFDIRAALHAGIVKEDSDMFSSTNIWGSGINTTARILSTSKTSQLLVSAQYFDDYLKDQREQEFSFGRPYSRTVKHGVHVQVMNATRGALCLSEAEATDEQWSHIGNLWQKMADEYEFFVKDTLRSAETLAAIGAAKFLLALGEREKVREFCRILSTDESTPGPGYPQQGHNLFTAMPADVLMEVLDVINPRFVKAGEIICRDGLLADICYLPLAGAAQIECSGREIPIPFRKGVVYGEMGLWVSNLIRSETARAINPGLVLELHHSDFCAILERHPGVADVVYGMIKLKVIENTWHSSELFPGLSTDTSCNFSHLSADCAKFAPGDSLDLTEHAHILLTGRVRIRAFTGVDWEVTGGKRCDRMGIAGIISAIGLPDGDAGEVLEETVAVRIPHETLSELQQQYPKIGQTWTSLCARRMDEVGFRIGPKRDVKTQHA
jgi:CRP-like cAMP-binding protein/class 3 adenylate cyclase